MVYLWKFMNCGEWQPNYPGEYGVNYAMANNLIN